MLALRPVLSSNFELIHLSCSGESDGAHIWWSYGRILCTVFERAKALG